MKIGDLAVWSKQAAQWTSECSPNVGDVAGVVIAVVPMRANCRTRRDEYSRWRRTQILWRQQMKVGDLVVTAAPTSLMARPDTELLDGPRLTHSTSHPHWRTTYAVAWFDAKETFWHNDEHLEVLSESR